MKGSILSSSVQISFEYIIKLTERLNLNQIFLLVYALDARFAISLKHGVFNFTLVQQSRLQRDPKFSTFRILVNGLKRDLWQFFLRASPLLE